MADEDYVSARMAYHAGLPYPSLWQSQQTIEKYLKCILLLHRIPAKQIRHSLLAALEKVEYSGMLSLNLKPISKELIQHIDQVGECRYFEVSTSTDSRDLTKLDRLVWELRRFCTLDPSPRRLELEQGKLAPRYQLTGGALESILSSKDNPARKALLLHNGFLGGSRKKKIKTRIHWNLRTAPLDMHPELLNDILEYVHLPKHLIKAVRGHKPPFYEIPSNA